jgi:hypothetical protein
VNLLEIGLTALAFGLLGLEADMVWTAWKTRPMPRHRKEQD